MNKYKRNSKVNIKQLKIDLMNSNTFPSLSNNSKTNKISHLNSIKNEDIQKLFKHNAKEILLENLGSKDKDIDKNLKYREIKFREEVNCFFKLFSIYEDRFNRLLFYMKENGFLIISRWRIINNNPTFTDKRINNLIIFGKNEIFISKIKNIKMNGAFKINNFNISSFNRNGKEKEMIHNIIIINEKPFEYMVIESPFNKANMKDVIRQMKSDKIFFEKIMSKRKFYCRIMNNNQTDNSIINLINKCWICILSKKSQKKQIYLP